MLSKKLLDILVCPHCRAGLQPDERHELLECRSCKRRFRVENDIPIIIAPDERTAR